MNCDKEYSYKVRGLLLAKVDEDTGEEVLNRDGSIKYFAHLDNNIEQEYDWVEFTHNDVREI